jgi:hypothetical protein
VQWSRRAARWGLICLWRVGRREYAKHSCRQRIATPISRLAPQPLATRPHRIESDRSRWANRDLSRFRGCLRRCTADKAQNQFGKSLDGMLRAQAGSIGDHGQETWTKRKRSMSESLRATVGTAPKQVSDARLERLAAQRGRASAEAYVLLELREARSAGDRVSAFHTNGRYTIRSVSQ